MAADSEGGYGGPKAEPPNSDINVTPMADVMLVLLIIFMITTPLLQEGVFVNKPRVENSKEEPLVDAELATMVTVTRDQSIYVNKRAVSYDDLVEQLSERVAEAPELPLFVKSDVAAPYGAIVEIVNLAREVGVERIGLMVDRNQPEEALF